MYIAVFILLSGCGRLTDDLFPDGIPHGWFAVSAPHWRDEVSAFVMEHESLLTEAVLEIRQADGNIRFDGSSIHRQVEYIENEVLLSVLELEEIISIRVRENIITFSMYERGLKGGITISWGVYYLMSGDVGNHPWTGQRIEITQHGEGWLWRESLGAGDRFYTERIVGNFFYFESIF